MDGSVWAIQLNCEVKRDDVTQLGLNQNRVDLVPATMPNISISIEDVPDRANYLVTLSGQWVWAEPVAARSVAREHDG